MIPTQSMARELTPFQSVRVQMVSGPSMKVPLIYAINKGQGAPSPLAEIDGTSELIINHQKGMQTIINPITLLQENAGKKVQLIQHSAQKTRDQGSLITSSKISIRPLPKGMEQAKNFQSQSKRWVYSSQPVGSQITNSLTGETFTVTQTNAALGNKVLIKEVSGDYLKKIQRNQAYLQTTQVVTRRIFDLQ